MKISDYPTLQIAWDSFQLWIFKILKDNLAQITTEF